jgi:ceramide glucosyltransferase
MIDDSLLHWISDICSAGAVLGCIYTLLAAVLTIKFARRQPHIPKIKEPVTLLKPLCGSEPGSLARLSSFCRQNYESSIQLVFGTQDRNDRVIAVVESVGKAFPGADIDLEVDARAHGSNRKISNLVNMIPQARNDVLILSDSDIEVGPSYVSGMVGMLQQPGVGAVTCVYHGVPGAPGLWSQIAALSTNTQFLPNAVVAITCKLAKPCFGATIAMRRETLDGFGGFPALADTLADDFALGEAVRAGGLDVEVAPGSVGHACFHASASELFLHQIRSARTVRSIDPVGYAGSIITNPLPLALLAVMTGAGVGLLTVAAAVVCRLILCRAVESAFALPRQPYWLLPLCDLGEFAVYVASFFGGKVSWKGYRYRINADGTFVQDSQIGRS